MEAKTLARHIRGSVLVLASILLFSWIACSGGGSGVAVSSNRLAWDAPMQFADGGTLVPSEDLIYFEIYINETGTFLDSDIPGAVIPAVDASTGSAVTTFDLATITPPLEKGKTYYLSMKTIEINGGRSDFTPTPLQIVY